MKLIPYPGLPHPRLSIDATAERKGRMLLLRYRIAGAIEAILLGQPISPRRADDLWQTTCFEAFARSGGGPCYFEFNFAPSGEWAAYRFEEYRAGRKNATLGQAPIIAVMPHAGGLAIDVYCDPDLDGALELNITAVIEEKDGAKSYWALAHPPGTPDFHDPACFALELPAANIP